MSKRIIEEKIKSRRKIVERAHKDVASYDILRTESCGYIETDPDEKTYDLTQSKIRRHVSIKACEQAYDLKLDNGPIYAKYSRNGMHMLLRNDRGYLASFNVKSMDLHFEIDVNDKIYDATYLHNERFIAVAQKNNIFIYDGCGVEIHCVRDNKDVFKMEYLPYHYLLASVSRKGFLRYQDVSTGKIVSQILMKSQEIASIKQNPMNAIIHTGSNKGVVSLWSPSSEEYLMKILCHKSAISSIEIERDGRSMITVGMDNRINIWDLRNTYTQLNTLKAKPGLTATSLSQKSMLALSYGDNVHIWKDFINSSGEVLYIKHKTGSPVSSVDFCNHEDILCIGHANGISNIIVPGCGDPVYDSYEDSPFISKKARREKEVKMLMEKIPYELISIESKVGSIYKEPKVDKPKEEFPRYFEAEPVRRGALSRFYNRDG
ncbi:U3 small nucleolar RNA-associated protein 7 [Encephalitozoon hellem]|uniref:U3 small nucleolar RNA-associated protein 7 n=1 Tax=Encephalitozoon hellem TaxID=27973 RepID=A0ABY8CKQ2_ENCHE|nr:U3 small nucleolar RNA-associated protein 7 [Encephalitozoon hellem]